MNDQNTEKLIEDFPVLYRGVDLPISQNLMAFGFECGDGWFDLIYNLSNKIAKSNNDVLATQVKEKFGTLRFYICGGDDEVYKAIDEAEHKSGETCEECGKPGVLCHTGGWVKTICSKCMEEINTTYSHHYVVCKKGEEGD